MPIPCHLNVSPCVKTNITTILTQSKSQEFPSSRVDDKCSQMPGVLRTIKKASDINNEAI